MSNEPPLDGQSQVSPRSTSRRIVFAWVGVAVFVGGNVADLLNWIGWGPGQTGPDRVWILFPAGLFWLSLATLIVLAYDVLATWFEPDHKPPLPTKLIGPGWIPDIADRIRVFATKHFAFIGVAGLVAGAVIGHLVWKP
jgi:hypothetical protein